jgi:acetyltransferase-like isoleucine patch superfamily enzyme
MNLINRLFRKIRYSFTFYIYCGADKVKYLRFLGVKIGEGCTIHTTAHNFGSEPWLIEIGNNITVCEGVLLITHDGTSHLFRDQMPDSSIYGNRFGTIHIYDNCFIGSNSILLPGIEIGPDAAIGAGSVVTKTVPPRSIVAGNPAKYIRSLDEYMDLYKSRMIPIQAVDRELLRKELTVLFWGNER